MFQSTHSLRSATQYITDEQAAILVSIHALLAECDGRGADEGGRPCGFNPRTPCGVRRYPGGVQELLERFQSTHSLRSATYYDGAADATSMVSIHALLAECDPAGSLSEPGLPGFNPRTPCGVRLLVFPSVQPVKQVSIHALLAECDGRGADEGGRPCGFNPRTPCGVRRYPGGVQELLERFQSTHSLRSATYYDGAADATSMVSIHALLAECDPAGSLSEPGLPGFNPRTPCGVRLLVFPSVQPVKQVSIHALLAECDLWLSGH